MQTAEKVFPNAWNHKYELRERMEEFDSASQETIITGNILSEYPIDMIHFCGHKHATDSLAQGKVIAYSVPTSRGKVIVIDFGIELTGKNLWNLMRSVGPHDAGDITGPLDDLRRLLYPKNSGDDHLVARHGADGNTHMFNQNDFEGELFRHAFQDYMRDAELYYQAMMDEKWTAIPIAVWETKPREHWWKNQKRKRTDAIYSPEFDTLRTKIIASHSELKNNQGILHPRSLNAALGNLMIAHFDPSVTRGFKPFVKIPGQTRDVKGAKENFHGGLQIDVTLRQLQNEKRILQSDLVNNLETRAPHDF